MERNEKYPVGLTRLIFEALVRMTPEVLDCGEAWNAAILDRVQSDVYNQLAPEGSPRQRLIFNVVFHRAFREARDLILGLAALKVASDLANLQPIQQAMA